MATHSIEDENIPVICCILDCNEVADVYDYWLNPLCEACAEFDRAESPENWEDE